MFLVSVWPWEEPGVSLLSSGSGAVLRTGVSTLRSHTYLQKRLQVVPLIFNPSGISLSYNKNAISSTKRKQKLTTPLLKYVAYTESHLV